MWGPSNGWWEQREAQGYRSKAEQEAAELESERKAEDAEWEEAGYSVWIPEKDPTTGEWIHPHRDEDA